ncbi:NAD(P)/FAD-dependent oxidoreductase [soil metagenome]
MSRVERAGETPKIVIVGGGFGGAYAAQTLEKLGRCDCLTLIDRNNYLLFYPLLIEAGVGAIEPRHVVVPIRRFVSKGTFTMAEVSAVDLKLQTVTYRVIGQESFETIYYDHLVLALGSITRLLPIPGLKDFAFEIKSLSDAIELRDRGIRLLELANTVKDKKKQRDILRHVVLGANFTGIEFAGEYQAFLKDAAADYPNLSPDDVEMIVLEHGERILSAVDPKLAAWASAKLTSRGVNVMTHTSLKEVGKDYAELTNGQRLATQSVVWAAGIAPNPMIARIEGLPLNVKGYIDCESDLRAKGFDNVWAVGDGATSYGENGKPYPATAQTASRQGPLAAKNIDRVLNSQPTVAFRYKPLGSFAAIGHRSAAADFLGHNVKGFLGWFLFRAAYLAKMPTFAMKARLSMDWFLELVLPSESVQIGVHRPRSRDAQLAEKPEQDTSASVR